MYYVATRFVYWMMLIARIAGGERTDMSFLIDFFDLQFSCQFILTVILSLLRKHVFGYSSV